jgi:head-tail adaptor
MTIGELDRRITLQYPTVASTDYGSIEVSEWTNYRTVWAKMEWDGGSESDETDKITSLTKVNFYIRNLDLDSFISGTDSEGAARPTMEYRIRYTDGGALKYYYLHNIEQIEGRDRFVKIKTEQKD